MLNNDTLNPPPALWSYLGHGVSDWLEDHRTDEIGLDRLGLPQWRCPADIAHGLRLTERQLRWLVFHRTRTVHPLYDTFIIPKKSGDPRLVRVPHPQLKAAQRQLHLQILSRLGAAAQAHGFVTGKNIVTNARIHVGQEILLNLDLKNFFDWITFDRVRQVFNDLGYCGSVATILSLLCTESPRKEIASADGSIHHVAIGPRSIPQGVCTSPALSNQVMRGFDDRLGKLAGELRLRYSRYADDITFSGSVGPSWIGFVLSRVRSIARDEGLLVNEKKTRVHRKHTSQRVTGLIVNNRVAVPRKERRRLRAVLHHAIQHAREPQDPQVRVNFFTLAARENLLC